MDDLKIGDKVQVVYRPFFDKEYELIVIDGRKHHNGDIGNIINISDSHGTCYEIQFAFGKAWYEPDELIKLESKNRKIAKYQWEGRLESYLSNSGEDIRKDESYTPSKPKIRISFDEETGLIVEKRIPSDEDTPQYKPFDPQLLKSESILKELIKGFLVNPVT